MLQYDNFSVTLLAASPIIRSRIKHVESDQHFVREQVVQGLREVKHVASEK